MEATYINHPHVPVHHVFIWLLWGLLEVEKFPELAVLLELIDEGDLMRSPLVVLKCFYISLCTIFIGTQICWGDL